MKFIFKLVIIMTEIKGYKTKQRAVIEAVLKASKGHLTVEEICKRLEKSGENVGRTTVYRTLERLEKEGTVRKYSSVGDSSCYQYVSNAKACNSHFHLKCESCGRLIHLECGELTAISGHIAEHHGFSVNPLKTVFYGVCEVCKEK